MINTNLSLVLSFCLFWAEAAWSTPSKEVTFDQAASKGASEVQSTFKILCLGDSLTDGYGVSREKSWPTLFENHLKSLGYHHIQVVNAGLSGSTSASGLSRLQWQLKSPHKPNLLILALGANDGLRGIDVKSTRKNLEEVLKLAKSHGIKLVLAGMQMPTNYGALYTSDFAKMYVELAKEFEASLIPFLLDGVATVKDLNQADGIHPNEKGYERVVQNIIPVVTPLLPKKS